MSDYQPGAAQPSADPLGDPAEAELQERLAAARALVDGIPIAADTAQRFLERDAVEALALLKQHEWSYFWALTRKLAPFTILGHLNSALAKVSKELAEGEQRIAERVRVVALGVEVLELWHDGSEAWTYPKEHGPGCCWRMPSSEAKRYLLAAYGDRNQITLEGGRKAPLTPGRQAVVEAMDQLEAMAHSGPRRAAPSLRVGGDGARLVIDLCRDDYSVVVVTTKKWEVVKPSPLAIRRAKGMKPLPLPVQGAGAALGDLRTMLGFDGEEHDDFWALVVGYMFAALRPKKPYFVGFLSGHQGSGKSTTAQVIRAPVDPHEDEAQPKPKSEDDLFVNCDGQWLVGYDNLSSLSQDWSDAFCRISTGSGYSKRKLCTDRDTVHFQVARPQLITAIVDIAAAPDLLDRGLLMQQPELDDEHRIGEEAMAEAIEQAAPAMLGQLLDAAVVALRKHRTVQLPALPRMAEPTRWVEAAAEVLGLTPLQFFNAYRDSRARAGEMALEASVVGAHLESFLALRKQAPPPAAPWFRGTSKHLLAELDGFMAMAGRARGNSWPRTPQGMGRALHRIAPALGMAGYTVLFERDPHTQKRDRWITLAAPSVEVPSDISDVSDIKKPPPQKKEGHARAGDTPSFFSDPEKKRPKRPNGPEPETVQAAERTRERCAHCGDELERGEMLPLDTGGHVHHRCADAYLRTRDAASVDPAPQALAVSNSRGHGADADQTVASMPLLITHAMKARLRQRGVHPGVIRELRPEDARRLLAEDVPVPLNAARDPQQDLRELAACLARQDRVTLARQAMRYAAAGVVISPETIDAIRSGGAVAYPVRDALWSALS